MGRGRVWVALVMNVPGLIGLLSGVAVSAFGGLVAVGAWIARVSFFRDRVEAVGVLWSGYILRKSIFGVEKDMVFPFILWCSRPDWFVVTPLIVLSVWESVLPRRVFVLSRLFLQRLATWAGD